MQGRWRRYVRFHVDMALLALGFFLYALLVRTISPDGLPHCILHDVLHLYCPFCGGTRTFLALLRFDLVTAACTNPAVLLAALVALVLDVRAAVRIANGREGALLPPWLWRVAVICFFVYALLLNTAMLYGWDLPGDLYGYWSALSPLRTALFFPLTLLLSLLFWGAIGVIPLRASLRAPCAIGTGALLVTVLLVLYAHAWLAFGYIPVLVCTVLLLFHRRKKRTP